ncbi:MAG: sigma-70 family RNA polymerase sigma factor [Thalassospira sp.]|uniref:sigma-70 family RNA polymerase sigma factor n=1 Tax=Thalassospira sp. TaxID=1912094 RepID=UPI0032ED5AC9
MSGTTTRRPGPTDPVEAKKCADWIVAVATSRDRDAFAQLFAHFAPRVKAYMFRFGGNSETAEELAQEAMMQVWRKAHLYDPVKAAASTWIFTIARNLRIDRFRQRKHIEVDDSDPTLIIDEDPLADEVVNRDQEAVLVKAAMQDLPADQKVVVELSFFEDCSHSEISERLDIPLGTVKSRLRLALGKLRGGLEGVA